LPEGTTLGVVTERKNGLRAGVGSTTISFASMDDPMEALAESMRGVSPATTMVSSTVPSSSITSIT
jgi:hypothetical protein